MADTITINYEMKVGPFATPVTESNYRESVERRASELGFDLPIRWNVTGLIASVAVPTPVTLKAQLGREAGISRYREIQAALTTIFPSEHYRIV